MASIRGSDPPWKVTEVIPEFADAFGFEQFNRMQCEALPGILDTDANVVASAPTASGKTALAELAICRTLQAGGTALFIAPMRALTNEKESEWDRFEQLGYSVYVVTGERDLNPRRAGRADILVMTPEKADSATRKHESARYSFVTRRGFRPDRRGSSSRLGPPRWRAGGGSVTTAAAVWPPDRGPVGNHEKRRRRSRVARRTP